MRTAIRMSRGLNSHRCIGRRARDLLEGNRKAWIWMRFPQTIHREAGRGTLGACLQRCVNIGLMCLKLHRRQKCLADTLKLLSRTKVCGKRSLVSIKTGVFVKKAKGHDSNSYTTGRPRSHDLARKVKPWWSPELDDTRAVRKHEGSRYEIGRPGFKDLPERQLCRTLNL